VACKRILLIRHGETAHNKNQIVQPADTPLSEVGLAQASLLAMRLSADNIGAILCSDLPRAKQTAQQIHQQLTCEISFTDLLRERNFGDLRGLPYTQIGVDFFAQDYIPPMGESWPQFNHRVAEAWQQIVMASNKCSADLVVVTHGLVCKAIVDNHLHKATGISIPDKWSNTSVTEIVVAETHQLRMINNTDHLPEDMNANLSDTKV
jgi:2,3-bisphosphoglycerate-dependent phosphoglycerate mutase